MNMTFKTMTLGLVAALGMASPAYAQAPASSWATLAAQAKSAGDKAEVVNNRINALVACGRTGKIYAPGATGADTQGCMESTSNSGMSMTSLANSLSTLNSNMNSVSNNFNMANGSVSAILECNRKGQVYNGTACTPASTTAANCKLATTRTTAQSPSCPASYTETGNAAGGTSKICMRVICN